MKTAPNLNRKLILEAAQRVADDAGGYVLSWMALGVIWAEITPGSGRELAGPAVPVSRVPYRITVRAAPDGSEARPYAGQRFREGARVYLIDAVRTHDHDGHYLTCFVYEEAAT